VFLPYDDNKDDHGVCRADTAQALALSWHFLALHKATVRLHWSVCFMPNQPGGMVVAFAIHSFTFFYIIDNRLAKQ
jgi:hypothetical protein